jgi:trigger factor
MATLLSWTSVGIGDLDVFLPSPPCLVVYTSYADGEPESSVTYFWQDEATGQLHHELVYQQPVSFDTAVAWAQEHAPTRNVERIHVKHARERKVVEPKARAGLRRGAAKKAPAKKAAPRKAAARKTAARKTAPAKRSPAVKGRGRKA